MNPVDKVALEILNEIAAKDPISLKQMGQGPMDPVCKYCGMGSWTTPPNAGPKWPEFSHLSSCQWLRATEALVQD